MGTLGERIRIAREAKGWTQEELAKEIHRRNRAFRPTQSTIQSWENGDVKRPRPLPEAAAALDVRDDWLFAERGPMGPRRGVGRFIPVMGFVGASATVEMVKNIDTFDRTLGMPEVELPPDGHIAALIVDGSSQWPRWQKGEIILYDPRPSSPHLTLNQYAIVETVNGERLIKIVRKALTNADCWRLESHNAEPIEMPLRAAYRYLGALAAPEPEPLPDRTDVTVFPETRRGKKQK